MEIIAAGIIFTDQRNFLLIKLKDFWLKDLLIISLGDNFAAEQSSLQNEFAQKIYFEVKFRTCYDYRGFWTFKLRAQDKDIELFHFPLLCESWILKAYRVICGVDRALFCVFRGTTFPHISLKSTLFEKIGSFQMCGKPEQYFYIDMWYIINCPKVWALMRNHS